MVALLVGVIGVVGYTNMRETGNQVDVITEVETPALVRLAEIKLHILVAVESAFAFPLLDDPNEIALFHTNLEQFDTAVAEFREIAHLGQQTVLLLKSIALSFNRFFAFQQGGRHIMKLTSQLADLVFSSQP